MRRQRWWLSLVALVFVANWKSTLALPVPDEELDTSTKLLGSSVVTSVSIVTGAPDNVANENNMKTSTADRRRVIPSTDLPASPANLMRPDKFQFFTLNKDGNVVTKQMTEQEIQSLIAAGGGHLPMEIHEPQKVGDLHTGGMKVADVVQNVQNVLKGELRKPATVMTSMPTIPGHVNTEWSSILPAILGGESETSPAGESGSLVPIENSETPIKTDTGSVKIPVSTGIQTITTKLPANEPGSSSTVDYDSAKRPTGFLETGTHTEKPMIQVPVITVDQKLPSHLSEEDSTPVFQMLNTISADKTNAQNNTHIEEKPIPVETTHEDTPEKSQAVAKPERLPIEPSIVKEPIVEQATVAADKIPEMIEINYNSGNIEPSVIAHVIKPIVKPESGTMTSETISNLPAGEVSDMMTVVSETHSTSMKVSGQEEIPLRKPPVPLTEPADRIQEPTEPKKPEFFNDKSTVSSITDSKLDLTTLKAEVITEQPAEISTEQSLLSQGVSFFGNLPQTVSSIVSNLISNNSSGSTPIVEEADVNVSSSTPDNVNQPIETNVSVKTPEPTKLPVTQTTSGFIKETVTSIKPADNQKPVYQLMPEIIPDNKKPAPETLPSEVSSIEHIIETLNDPTGSISGTVAADHVIPQNILESQTSVNQADANRTDPPKTTKIPEIQTSTSATPTNAETSAESSSAKPMEALPTELADSLTSMISQISDEMPSVLPLGQNAGLDTTEKKNVNVNAEESAAIENSAALQNVSEIPEDPVNRVQLPVQAEPEKPAVVPTKVAEIKNSTVATTADVKEPTQELKVTFSTELPSVAVTTQASSLENSTTVKTVVQLASNESSEFPVNRVDQPVAQKLEALVPKPEQSKPEVDEIQASSDITTDKVIPQAVAQDSVKIETVTESTVSVATPIEKTSTAIPSTIDTSSAYSNASTVSIDRTEAPAKVSTESPAIVQDPLNLDNQMTETPIQIKLNENHTELPIVHLDITEAKPTKFHRTNESQTMKDSVHGAESPLVRIKLTDPVTLINNMIESSNVNVSPSIVVPLSLPETGSVPPNTIASGLIAGFPSSANPETTVANLNPDANLTTVDPVKSPPEVLILSDAPASNLTEAVKTNDVKKSELQTKNDTKPQTQELEIENNVTQKVELTETPTPKIVPTAAPEISVERIDSPKESALADSPKEPTTAHVDSNSETSTNKPRLQEPITEMITATKSAETEPSTMLVITTELPEDQNTSTKLVENVTVIAKEPTTTVSPLPIDEAPENRIKISAPPIPELIQSGDELIESTKINEMSANTSSKPSIITENLESMEIKINSSDARPESINFTKSEVSDAVIDIGPEKDSEKIPLKIASIDMSAVETIADSKKPLKDEGIPLFHTIPNSQPITTMPSSIESSIDNNKLSSNISLQATTVSTIEKTAADLATDEPKLENDAVETEKIELIAESTLSEKIAEPPSPISAPQQTEEIRIRVNDTAVLVTKRPISDISNQKLGEITKSPENHAIEEQPTTPKVASVTEDPYVKLGEKIQLPVPAKVSGLSYSDEGHAAETSIKNGTVSPSGTETRIRLGDEQANKIEGDKIQPNVDDIRKPITKNSDDDLSPIEEKYVSPVLTTKEPLHVNEKIPADQANDTDSQLTTKVEITTNASSSELSNFSNINDSIKVLVEPIKLPENDAPSKLVTDNPIPSPGISTHKPTMNIKKDDALPEPTDDQWTLIPQQVYPALTKTSGSHGKQPITTDVPLIAQEDEKITSTERPPVSLEHPQSASGLDSTVKNLETDVSYFANLCNELAFTFWTATNKGLSTARSLAVSPFGMTSMLAMVFLGARGPTSDQMNDILKLDDVASFNPHLVFQNVTDAVSLARNQGIANAAFVRELFADRSKVRKLMPFYKERAQQFYDGMVAEVNFATISDLVRRRTNLMIRKQTGGRIKDFVRTNTVPLRSPLAALSANVFQTDCNSSAASSEGRDGELYFAVSPAVRQRKLVPVPATVWRAGVLAGYEPGLDATAIALGGIDKLVSTIFIIPGQQGLTAPGDTLDRLEQRLIRGATHDGSWNKLLKVLIPRPGLELQVPKFSHRSVINATAALKRMGLEELFSKHADLQGINGVATDLHLADVLQMNLFSTCGDENIISGRHHVEVYPGSPLRNAREYSEYEEQTDDMIADHSGTATLYVPHRETRSARQNDSTEKQRLKLDRPFLYFVRHNPTGLILHMGRFNPRLLP